MSQPKRAPSTIYAIQCTNNGKVYVGCSVNFESRIMTHFNELKKGEKTRVVRVGKREPTEWQKDYNRYGRDAFKVYILEKDVPPASAFDREDYWIDYYDAQNPDHGYNVRHGLRPVQIVVEPGKPKRFAAASE